MSQLWNIYARAGDLCFLDYPSIDLMIHSGVELDFYIVQYSSLDNFEIWFKTNLVSVIT